MPPLPRCKGGSFLVVVSNRDEMYRVFDEEDSSLRPFFTVVDPLR